MLRSSPSFSAIVILTLALCIGSNTAIFSVVDAILLRTLPYPEPERLAGIVTHFRYHGEEGDQRGRRDWLWQEWWQVVCSPPCRCEFCSTYCGV